MGMSHLLAREGGPELVLTVIATQDVWRGLTKHQRESLLNPAGPHSPQTLAALERKKLWDGTGPTALGEQVVRFRPDKGKDTPTS